MEARHGGGGDVTGAEYFHASVEAVVHDEVVRHTNAMRFHGMALAIVVVSYLGVVEVGNATGVFGCHFWRRCWRWSFRGCGGSL